MNNSGNELFMRRANNYISESQRKAMGAVRIPKGAIVFAKVGAAVFLERKRILAQDSCIDNNMAAFIVDEDRVDIRFAHHLLTAFRMSSLVATTALPSLNGGQLQSIPLCVPKDIREQRRIAAALGDADDLIASLGRLTTKKQAIKQSMMQRLLTGKTRLPGFSGAWREGTFEQLASPSRERVMPQNASSTTTLIELEHIESHSGRLTGASQASDAVSLKAVFKSGDVLFGKLRAYLRKFWHANRGGLCTTEIWVLHPRAGINGLFVRYVVETDRFVEVASGAYGTHMPRSDWGSVRSVPVSIPSHDEQVAIATVLVDADAEIDTLYRRLEKAKDIKTGMMQELLTGRTRLPTVEAAA